MNNFRENLLLNDSEETKKMPQLQTIKEFNECIVRLTF